MDLNPTINTFAQPDGTYSSADPSSAAGGAGWWQALQAANPQLAPSDLIAKWTDATKAENEAATQQYKHTVLNADAGPFNNPGFYQFLSLVAPMLSGPLGPILGEALGIPGGAGELVNAARVGSSLISAGGGAAGAAASGGNPLIGALTGGLGSFAGSALGDYLGHLGGAAGGAVDAAASGPALSPSAFVSEFNGTNPLTTALSAGGGAALSPLTVTGAPSSLVSGLGGAVGGAAGGAAVSPLTVTGSGAPPPTNGIGGVTGSVLSGVLNGPATPGTGQPTEPDVDAGDQGPSKSNPLLGAVGNIAGSLGTSLLTGLLHPGDSGPAGAVGLTPATNPTAAGPTPGGSTSPGTGAPGGGAPGTPAAPPVANISAGSGSSGSSGTPGGGMLSTGAAAAGSPAAAAPDISIDGSMAPNIYPWRRQGADA